MPSARPAELGINTAASANDSVFHGVFGFVCFRDPWGEFDEDVAAVINVVSLWAVNNLNLHCSAYYFGSRYDSVLFCPVAWRSEHRPRPPGRLKCRREPATRARGNCAAGATQESRRHFLLPFLSPNARPNTNSR